MNKHVISIHNITIFDVSSETITVSLSKPCTLKPKSWHFYAPKSPLSWKWMTKTHKTFSIYSRKRCCANCIWDFYLSGIGIVDLQLGMEFFFFFFFFTFTLWGTSHLWSTWSNVQGKSHSNFFFKTNYNNSVLERLLWKCNRLQIISSLSVGHYELCRDDIGDLPGSPNHLCKEKTPMNIG